MRIAFCFFGQFRNVLDTYERSYKQNLFDVNSHHQIDFFVHSWFDKTTVGTTFMAANRERNTIPGSTPVPENIIQQVYELYNPVAMHLEHPIEFDEQNYNEYKLPDAHPGHGLSRAYSINQVNWLRFIHAKHRDIEYDKIVFARYDLMLHAPVLFDNAPNVGVYHLGQSPHGFNPNLLIGDIDSMIEYAELFHSVDFVYNKLGIIWSDETISAAYLNAMNIPIHDMNISSSINRGV